MYLFPHTRYLRPYCKYPLQGIVSNDSNFNYVPNTVWQSQREQKYRTPEWEHTLSARKCLLTEIVTLLSQLWHWIKKALLKIMCLIKFSQKFTKGTLCIGWIQFKVLTTLPLKFMGFWDKNWKSKMTSQERHYSSNLQKICNIIGPKILGKKNWFVGSALIHNFCKLLIVLQFSEGYLISHFIFSIFVLENL